MNFFNKYSSSKFSLPIEKHYLFLDGIWNLIGTSEQNHSNQLINEENLKFQRERAEIEDARYAEETAYNRAWAEENRDYERALQQTIFDREDTAIQRQAESLSSLGINPASQQLNGLGAGQALSPSTAPTASTQDSDPLHSDYRKENELSSMVQGMQGGLSSLISIANTMEGLQTGKYQRDALALENDRKFLENMRIANGLGISYKGLFNDKDDPHYIDLQKKGLEKDFTTPSGISLYDTDEYKNNLRSTFRKDYLDSVPNWVGNLTAIADDSIYNKAEKALTKASDIFDNVTTKLGNESIYELGKMNNKFNLAQFLKTLLF